jgi:hypothetical protein
MANKGKGIQVDNVDEVRDSEDNDFFYVPKDDDSNSSTDDDEAINYREQTSELKKQLKRKMLGDD